MQIEFLTSLSSEFTLELISKPNLLIIWACNLSVLRPLIPGVEQSPTWWNMDAGQLTIVRHWHSSGLVRAHYTSYSNSRFHTRTEESGERDLRRWVRLANYGRGQRERRGYCCVASSWVIHNSSQYQSTVFLIIYWQLFQFIVQQAYTSSRPTHRQLITSWLFLNHQQLFCFN